MKTKFLSFCALGGLTAFSCAQGDNPLNPDPNDAPPARRAPARPVIQLPDPNELHVQKGANWELASADGNDVAAFCRHVPG